jgi:hypothetical protein
MEKFENALVKTLTIIYRDIEREFIEKEIEYTQAEVYEKACKLLQEALTAADPGYEWEINLTYESMKDLYDKNV